MKGRCFLVTVGTSVLPAAREKWAQEPAQRKSWLAEEEESEVREAVADWIDKKLKTPFQNDLEDVSELDFTKASAELAALFGDAQDGEEPPFHGGRDDRVVLIATRTAVGAYCAELIARLLRDVAEKHQCTSSDCVVVRYPKHLGSADDPEFARRGPTGFLNLCHKEIKAQNGRDVILAPNGGYKTLIAYMTILGLLHKLPVRYVFEDSPAVLCLPKLPIGLDRATWIEAHGHLKSLVGRPWEEVEATNPPYAGMLEANEKRKARWSPIGDYFETGFNPGFEEQAFNLSLGLHLREDGVDFLGMYRRLAQFGEAIWKGDRLPDLVDHGPDHHRDLLQFAESILLPLMRREGKPFLETYELFTLLGAILLHDCGHVVDVIETDGGPRLLEFDEIRRHHHILGFLRLANGPKVANPKEADPYLSRTIYQFLDRAGEGRWRLEAWPVWTWQRTWSEWLAAIATLGVYHRRCTPLIEPREKPYCAPVAISGLTGPGNELLPLRRLGRIPCGQARIPPQRMILLASLLRMIDCLDQQRSRIGSEQRYQLQIADIERKLRRNKLWRASVIDHLPDSCKEAAPRWEQQTADEAAASFAAITTSVEDPPKRVLLQVYRERLLEWLFLSVQKDHFISKRAVREVAVSGGADGAFQVRLEFDPSNDDDSRREAEGEILGDIAAEYNEPEVKRTLDDAGIRFEFDRKHAGSTTRNADPTGH